MAGAVLAAVLAAAVVVVSAGCGAGRHEAPGPGPAQPSTETAVTALPAGASSHELTVAGVVRTYRTYRPARLRTPAPLVVMLHGGFGDGAQAEKTYGWDAIADRDGLVVAYPDGTGRAWDVGGGCCGTPGRTGVDDVGFVRAVVAAVERAVPIDSRRVYATGISNGGMLAYRVACDTTVFAAVAPVAATLLGDCPHPTPVSVLHIHGTADGNVRLDGGPGDGVARIDGPPVPEVVARWRSTDACGPVRTTVAGAVTTRAADCPQGRSVDLITVAGAGHQWPGSRPQPAAARVLGLDPPSTALDATDTIARFFAAHPAP